MTRLEGRGRSCTNVQDSKRILGVYIKKHLIELIPGREEGATRARGRLDPHGTVNILSEGGDVLENSEVVPSLLFYL